MSRAVVIAVLVAALVAAAGARGDTPPPGATARCVDGTYSFSQTRQGTCSHHGGVAEWLTPTSGTTTTTPATTTTTTPATTTTTVSVPTTTAPTTTVAPPKTTTSRSSPGGTSTTPVGGKVDVGVTVLLAPRTKSSGCRLGSLPDRRCSPGAYSSKLTKAVICSPSFRTSTIRNVPDSEKHQVELEYGMAPRSYGHSLEIDHIVSLELGGSNAIANLFPERHPGFHAKDKLENKLHDMVCDGAIGLRAAQRRIAANWQALYQSIYGVPPIT